MPRIGADREFHDDHGNRFLLMGQRIMKNGLVLASPSGCTTVTRCELAGGRLTILFCNGQAEFTGVREGPPPPRGT
ncbi:MAG: hypothetical protein ACM3RP_03825 [Chitinophagales bacterium]